MGTTTRRNRISLAQELRIWDLRRQGYRLDEVARICNLPWRSVATATYRARLHWKYQGDPRLGRQRGWLSDQDVETIRRQRALGVSTAALARRYGMSDSSIRNICQGKTYATPCQDAGLGYNYDFTNRLVR